MSLPSDITLVTGASGLTGRHLVRYLSQQGERVRALYHTNAPDDELQDLPGVEWVQCDLLDIFAIEEVIEGVNEIYHCAGIVSFQAKDKERVLHFNIEATANIVNAALDHGVRKLVYMSSVAALGRRTEEKEITEEEQWEESKYNSVYALSKHLAEMEVWRGAGEGLGVAVVNPGIILGEGNWDANGSSSLLKVVHKEFPYYTQGVNGWVDVQDVVRAVYLLMKSERKEERYILCAGNFSYKEIFTLMAAAMDRKPPRIKAGKLMSAIVWRLSVLKSALTGKPSTITKETARTAQKAVYYNNRKFINHFPDFVYTPLKDTINRISAAFLKDHFLKN